jgi:hypothetical protein
MENKQAKKEIIRLALMLEEISEHVVFIDYSGHVKNLYVSVNESKENWGKQIFRGNFYTDFRYESDQNDYESIKEFLQSKINELTIIK